MKIQNITIGIIAVIFIIIIFTVMYDFYQLKYNNKVTRDIVTYKDEKHIFNGDGYYSSDYYIFTEKESFKISPYKHRDIHIGEIYEIKYYESLFDGRIIISIQQSN